MRSFRDGPASNRSARAASVLCGALLSTIGFASAASADDASTQAVSTVEINPGGGVQTNGSDGMRFSTTADPAGGGGLTDGHLVRNETQWCCGPSATGGGILLAVGTTSAGSGSMSGDSAWDSVTLVSTTGTATTSGGSATGSGSAVIRYTETIGGLVYQVDRTITYTLPNDYLTETYDVVIPAGNSAAVKLYYGGDTQPGGSDQGYGIMLTSPRRSVISLNTTSHVMFGFRETAGSVPFAGARSENLGGFGTNSFLPARDGGNIGFNAEAANHDASLAVQWDLGSTPGTVRAGMETFVTPQGVTLTGGFRDGNGDAGVAETLDFSIVNSDLTNATGVGFGFSLPSGLTIGSGTPTSDCGGTLTAAAGSGSVSLSGGAITATSNCVISVPVIASAGGTYSISSASVTSVTGLDNGVGSSSLVVNGPAAPTGGLVGITPARLLDTRATDSALDVGEIRQVVVAGRGGVPADATAVVVNATVVDAMWDGYLTLFPCGSGAPATSTLNFAAGTATSNSATIGLGTGGALCARSTAVAHLVLDVTAAHSPTASGAFVALTPTRLSDTRDGARVTAGTVHEVLVAGRGGIPADATAVALNLTVTDSSAAGYATVTPCGAAASESSNVNFGAAQTVANSAVVRVGTGGKVCVVASADAHFVVDATAAFAPTGNAGALVTLSPVRVVDSRPGVAAAGTTYEVSVGGQAGIPSSAAAAVLNVTLDAPSAGGYATVFPCGGSVPLSSNLNFTAGRTVANGVTVGLGTGGKVCVFTTADAGVVVDATGYFPGIV